jgi:signal transduction histidine kinase/CheY-like chemotaxis protein
MSRAGITRLVRHIKGSSWLRGVLGPRAEPLPPDLEPVLDPLIDRLMLIGLFVYPIVLAGFVYRILLFGWRSNIVLQVGFYLLLVAAYLTRKHTSFRARVLGLNAAIFVLGAVGVYQWGILGMGIPSLLFAVLFTSNLLETRHTYAALAAAVAIILAVGFGAVHRGLHDDLDVRGFVTSWSTWLLAAIQFVLLIVIILTVFRTLYDALIRMFLAEKERALELEQSRAQLRDEVGQREELEAQFIQAQKMEAVGRLAGGVAHDFNNQLFVILGLAETLKRRWGADSSSRRDLDLILQSTRQSAELTRQLLTFSRKQTIQPRVLGLNEVVRGIESMLRRLIGENIKLALELDPELELVNVDQGLLQQATVNLVVNARDAMPNGGTLTIGTRNHVEDAQNDTPGRVDPGRYVLLAVSDTGTGMSRETLAHIFEPFFTTKEGGKGTGLGLASVYGFVKQSGGEVTVESEKARGTTFTLYFRQYEVERFDADLREAPAPVREGHETILVVEDNEEVLDLLSSMLQEMGYRVIPCGDAEGALREFEAHSDQIDLVATDVVLPGMTGRELADIIQTRSRDVKAIFISGYSEDVISPHGVLEPGVHFIQKPFDESTLGRKIREVLDSPSC